MHKDIRKFGSLILVAGLLGWLIEKPLLAMLIASVGIIIWQLYQLQRLTVWIGNRNNVLPDTNGQFYRLYRIISQRSKKNRERKRQLTNYLKQFRKAASALPIAIVLVDDHGKIKWANNNAETLFGIRWPSDSGVVFTDLVRDIEVDKLLTKEDGEAELNSRLNADITLSVQVVRYTNDIRMVIGRDISRLIKTNQIQSNFVANVSHELKTPLTVLKGYLEILQNNPNITPELQRPLQQMNTQTERMAVIVHDLLYLAKLENKEDQTTHKAVDITHTINTIVETIDERLSEKQLKLELDIDYSLKILGCDTELHAAFSNLIFNAVNYTPRQGVINVSWQADKNGARFTVKDNGEGIPESHIPRLTERFYRVDNDRSREKGGTGLGLAIVKHVLQRHNASLKINSQLGVGSEFQCLFPAKQVLGQGLLDIAN